MVDAPSEREDVFSGYGEASAGYGECSRCGIFAMEYLQTHSHCWECNFCQDDEIDGKSHESTGCPGSGDLFSYWEKVLSGYGLEKI